MTIANGKCLECDRPLDLQQRKPVMNGDNRTAAWIMGSVCAGLLGISLAWMHHFNVLAVEKRQMYVACAARTSKVDPWRKSTRSAPVPTTRTARSMLAAWTPRKPRSSAARCGRRRY